MAQTPRQDAAEAIAALEAHRGALQALDPDEGSSSPLASRGALSLSDWGTILTVGPGSPATVYAPAESKDTNWSIELQAVQLPGGALKISQSAGYLAAFITYCIGGAKFTKTIAPIGLNVRRIPVVGRQVTVTVFMSAPGAPIFSGNTAATGAPSTTAPVQVQVGIAHDNQSHVPVEYFGPQWINPGSNTYMNSTAQQAVYGAQSRGVLLAIRTSVLFMPTGGGSSAFWIMLFDQTGVGGTYPIWRSKPLTAVNDWDSWDDQLGPSIEWAQGLWIGASTTPLVYNAVGGAPSFSFDVKVGQ